MYHRKQLRKEEEELRRKKILIWHLNFKCGLVDGRCDIKMKYSKIFLHHTPFLLICTPSPCRFFPSFSRLYLLKVIILPWYDAHMLPFSATFALIYLIQLLYVSPLHIQHDFANVMEYEKCGINFKWKYVKRKCLNNEICL